MFFGAPLLWVMSSNTETAFQTLERQKINKVSVALDGLVELDANTLHISEKSQHIPEGQMSVF